MNLLDQFGDFDDYLEDPCVFPFILFRMHIQLTSGVISPMNIDE